MASERRTCQKPKGCGVKFSRPLGSRRIYCERCSPPRKPKLSEVPTLPTAVPTGEHRLVVSTRSRLEAVGRLDSPDGVMALELAELIAAGGGTQSGIASLSTAWGKAMDRALAGAKPAEDALDELRRRREAKAAGA